MNHPKKPGLAAPPLHWPGSARGAAQPKVKAQAIQPFGWAVIDSRSNDDAEIVRNNLRLSSALYSNQQRVAVVTDPEDVDDVQRVALGNDEPLHIHGHGTDQSLAGFGADSLAREVLRKFTNLRGRTILLHSCEVGSGQFLRNFLQALANNNFQGWNGTQVLGPERFLVVAENGLSQVSKGGVQENDLKTRKSQQGKLMKKGDGWKGIQVVNQAIQDIPQHRIKAIVINAMKKG